MILKYSTVVTVYSSSVASSIQADGSSDEVHQHFGGDREEKIIQENDSVL